MFNAQFSMFNGWRDSLTMCCGTLPLQHHLPHHQLLPTPQLHKIHPRRIPLQINRFIQKDRLEIFAQHGLSQHVQHLNGAVAALAEQSGHL